VNETIDTSFFDPDFIQQLDRIDLIAKTITDGLSHGAHRSRRRGFSTEFSDFKPYVPGDDTRLLDWRIYARTERLFVKRFEAETNLELMLVLDATGSMAWRHGKNITKLEYAANLLAGLACLHMEQQDQVGLLVYDAADVHHLPPRSRRAQLDAIYATLAGLTPGRADSFPVLVESLTKMKRHRGRIVVCTDLEEDEEQVAQAMEELAGLEDEIILFHILDRAEVHLPFENVTHLEDAESGELLPVNLPELRREHDANLSAFRKYWEERCSRWGILYQPIDTGMNYVEVLFRLNDDRQRIA
jgi:uncharacterized protein (DUF58 family)